MRPTKLIISAFGPYAKKTEIDLDKLGTNGIYLITGDTGAGKTTIFDAISYALFDTPSGNAREVAMFRSKYAEPETPTFVELYFEYAGRSYRIKRNPEYMRPAKRGEDRYTKELARVELELPDGSFKTKGGEVKDAIKDILGVEKEQFAQIAMIAQGEFLKLLTGSTKERLEIFRELFKTKRYLTLQSRISDDSKALYGKMKDARNSVDQYINSAECSVDNVLYLELEAARRGERPVAEAMDIIAKIIEDDEAADGKLEEKSRELESEYAAVNKNIGIARKIEESRKNLEKVIKDIDKTEELKKTLDIEKLKSEKLQEESEKIGSNLILLKNELGEYDILEEKQKKKKELDDKINNSSKKTDSLNNKLSKDTAEYEAIREEQKELKDSELKLSETENLLENENRKSKAIGRIEDNIRNINGLKTDLEKTNDTYLRCREDYTEKEKIYNTAHRNFLDAQAGILADELADNQPCPVCGSTQHPQPAIKPEQAPTQAELDKYKEDYDKASAKANEISLKLQSVRNSLELKTENTIEQAREIMGDCSIEVIVEKIQMLSAECRNEKDRLNVLRKDYEEKVKRKKEIEELFPVKEKLIADTKKELDELRESAKNDAAMLSALEENLKDMSKKLRFATKKEAQKNIKDNSDRKNALDAEIKKIQSSVEECNNKALELSGQKNQLEQQLEDADKIELETEKSKEKKLTEEKEKLNKKRDVIKNRIYINKGLLENIQGKSKELTAIEDNYRWMQALSDTANGKLSKNKLMLETYIQMTYFERILARANTRFMIMSDNQYEFERNKGSGTSSQGGLELDIRDHYNGSIRSVNSLSGGEKFKASLSLALGLADEIQASAGGIKLDTMYIDEGFGSLDDESREQAIKALAKLSDDGNRLIGIISHVGDLKNKIDRQILVTKDGANGSKAELVV